MTDKKISLETFELASQRKTGTTAWLRALPYESPAPIPNPSASPNIRSNLYSLISRGKIPGKFQTKTIDGVLYVCRYPEETPNDR